MKNGYKKQSSAHQAIAIDNYLYGWYEKNDNNIFEATSIPCR